MMTANPGEWEIKSNIRLLKHGKAIGSDELTLGISKVCGVALMDTPN